MDEVRVVRDKAEMLRIAKATESEDFFGVRH
jgi:hypothetical protein